MLEVYRKVLTAMRRKTKLRMSLKASEGKDNGLNNATPVDAIVGAALNYNWDQVKNWVNSIYRSGFSGELILLTYSHQIDLVNRSKEHNFKIIFLEDYLLGNNFADVGNIPPHVVRFYVIWKFLQDNVKYRFCIVTDVRDVVFQLDPGKWLESHIGTKRIIASSEQVKYRSEPWGLNNIEETFGKAFSEHLTKNEIFNVGVIAGHSRDLGDLCGLIFQLSINRPIPIVDQAIFNYIMALDVFDNAVLKTNTNHGWAIQLGTTKMVTKDGNGTFAEYYRDRPNELRQLEIEDPIIHDGAILNKDGHKFVIVHQYDRIRQINEVIEANFNYIS